MKGRNGLIHYQTGTLYNTTLRTILIHDDAYGVNYRVRIGVKEEGRTMD